MAALNHYQIEMAIIHQKKAAEAHKMMTIYRERGERRHFINDLANKASGHAKLARQYSMVEE